MSKVCILEGCEKPAPKGRYCGMHQARKQRYGRLHLIRRANGSGHIGANGYVEVHVNGRRTYEHIVVAERALGKPLPKGAVVHHINEVRTDNRPENLVICPNESYHRLLHRRMRAKREAA
jgi:hypothetical protein